MLGWKIYGLVVLLHVSGSLGDPQPLSLKFCCPDGQVVETDVEYYPVFGRRQTAKCVSSSRPPLNGETILVFDASKAEEDRDRFVLRSISKAEEVGGVPCGRTVHGYRLPLGDNRPEEGSGNGTREGDSRITLRDGDSPNEGNIYIHGEPVCDDGWGANEANVACRMLGYPEGGQPTRETRWSPSYRTSDFRMDNVDCRGNEESLFDCRYRSEDDCSASEYAGVVCGEGRTRPGSMPSENMTLALSGDLIAYLGRQEAGSFCISRPSESCGQYGCNDYGDYYGEYSDRIYSDKNIQTVPSLKAYVCSKISKIIPSLMLEMLWPNGVSNPQGGDFSANLGHNEDYPTPIHWLRFIKMGDKDNSGTMTYDEFAELINDKIKQVFDIFDANEDGELEPDTEGKTLSALPFKLLKNVAETLFDYFDYTKDNVFSYTDDECVDYSCIHTDINGDGTVSFEELFRTGPPSTWPEAAKTLKDLLDANGDETLSKEEMMDFLTRTISAFDSNKDCKITSDEIANLILSLEGFPFGYGIAIKTVFDHYSLALNFVIPKILKKADKNQDQKTSLVELMEVDDWDWLMNELFPVTSYLGHPSEAYRYIMASDVRYEVRRRSDYSAKFAQKLLEGASNLLKVEAYTGSVDAHCSGGPVEEECIGLSCMGL